MTASVLKMASCVGVSGRPVSVIHDILGHRTKNVAGVSLLAQARALSGRHLHLNLIRVGFDVFPAFADNLLDQAVKGMRAIYAVASTGVGRVEHHGITRAQAGVNFVIDSEVEGSNLTHAFSADNNGLDVFVVVRMTGPASGRSPTNGPCDKNVGKMDGLLVSTENGVNVPLMAVILAHEVGHYLGLEHLNTPSNLMSTTGVGTNTVLNASQRTTIREDACVHDGCDLRP